MAKKKDEGFSKEKPVIVSGGFADDVKEKPVVVSGGFIDDAKPSRKKRKDGSKDSQTTE